MSHSLATSTPSAAFRRWLAEAWDDPDSRSTLVGTVSMLLFILILILLWILDPVLYRRDLTVRPHSTAREFNIELAPDTVVPKQAVKPKDPFKFVETNPEAPENTPDKTENFAAQNQQAAQEKPTDTKSDRPSVQGQKEIKSEQIVSGRLTTPMEHMPAQPPPPPEQPVAEQEVKAAKAEQNPLAGTEKFEGENKDGIGGNIAKRVANAKPIPEKIDGANTPFTEGATSMLPAIDPKRPRPRPSIVQPLQTRPAILEEKIAGTSNVGLTAIDAKWSQYGVYLQKLVEAVQIQWERLLLGMNANPTSGSRVSVTFVLNSEGKIEEIVNVESTANETGKRACVSAITDRAPYGPWTEDMLAVLGTRQQMTFTFYYLQQ